MVSAEKEENGNTPGDPISGELSIPLMAQYFNLLRVGHSSEEFYFELSQAPENKNVGLIVGRFVTSVAHAQRIHKALGENIAQYESKFGPITQPKAEDEVNGAK